MGLVYYIITFNSIILIMLSGSAHGWNSSRPRNDLSYDCWCFRFSFRIEPVGQFFVESNSTSGLHDYLHDLRSEISGENK